MTKAGGRPPKNDLPRFVQARQTAGGIAYYWVRANAISQAAGLPRPLGNSLASAKSQAAPPLNEQFNVWHSSASSSNSTFNKPAGFCPASDENESSTEFPNGGRNQFPNALKNLAENKAVSVKNSAR